MALTHSGHVIKAATEAKSLCDRLKLLNRDVSAFLAHNSDLSIDWAGDPKPAYINEDVAGNIDGMAFTRAAVANAIGSLDNFRKLVNNEAPTQGDHLGNFNQLADITS